MICISSDVFVNACHHDAVQVPDLLPEPHIERWNEVELTKIRKALWKNEEIESGKAKE